VVKPRALRFYASNGDLCQTRKEDRAVLFHPSKAQFAQPAISAEKIPGQAIIRFDEQICYQRR
jgi:hypothetical protein